MRPYTAVTAVGGGYVATDGLLDIGVDTIGTIASHAPAMNTQEFVLQVVKILGAIAAPIFMRWIEKRRTKRRRRRSIAKCRVKALDNNTPS